MLTEKKLTRINQLAKKAKTESLTDEEKKEQAALRKEYIDNVKKSFKNQLKSMKVIDPEGNDVTPNKVKNLQKNNRNL